MTTGKTIALTRQTLVSKVMSLLLNMLPRLIITFRSNSGGQFCKLKKNKTFVFSASHLPKGIKSELGRGDGPGIEPAPPELEAQRLNY